MTTLCAIQAEDWCVIAAESQATTNARIIDSSPVGKIAVNGKFLIAAAGATRGANLLTYAWRSPTPTGKPDEFITRNAIPSIRRCFMENGYDIKSEGQSASFDNELLLAIKGRLYHIFDDYGWERCGSGLYATGSGADFALGAMEALGARDCDDYAEAIDIAEQAVKIASKLDIFSGGLIQVAMQDKAGKSFVATLDEDDDE